MVKVFERKYPGVELHLMCIDDEAELERAYGTEMPIAGFWGSSVVSVGEIPA